MAFFTSEVAWSSEDICEVARQSHKSEYLSKFEQLIEEKSDLNNIDCDGRNLFEVAYRKFYRLPYFADVRPARFDNLILLIENGYDANKAGYSGNTALHMAAKKGDINLIYYLVDNGADINTRDDDGNIPLTEAIGSNLETINLLLYIVRQQNNIQYRENVFDKAIPRKAEIVELLLQHGLYPSPKQYEAVKRYAKEGVADSHKAQAIVDLIDVYREKRVEAILSGENPQKLSFSPPPLVSPQLLPPKKESSLIKAVRNGDRQKVKELISQQVNLNSIDRSGSPALHLAIALCHREIVKLLINAGANLTLQNAEGEHPLFLASDDYELTELLLKKGAPVDRISAQYKITALTSSNTIPVSKLLLDWGANINHQIDYGLTPLSHAIAGKNSQLFQFLLEQGADVNSVKTDGETLLKLAVKSNQPEIVRLLLDKASEEEKDRAYDLALLKGYTEISNILSQAKAKSSNREKLFDEAVNNNNIDLVRRLLNEGMDEYLITEKGSSNFLRSIQSADLEMTKLLLKNASESNFSDQKREEIVSDLLLTVVQHHYQQPIEAVDYLLKNGADVNVSDRYGRTPLYFTIERPIELMMEVVLPPDLYRKEEQRTADESLAIIKLLLDAGANIDVQTKVDSAEELVLSLKNNGDMTISEYANDILILFQKRAKI